ncbi:unnamed protein product [Echinostoma caproni]|uniref:ORF2 n=1 Tax=Echinostoma caproni TaxID=27848 RepID=A0A183B0J4_9TREM|nr:unnamed protein product [Echinostoma caproni]
MPNRYLGVIGRHVNADTETGFGGDCMDLTVNPAATLLATGCPATQTIFFWPLTQWTMMDQTPSKPKKGKRSAQLAPYQREHLSGLINETSEFGVEDTSDTNCDTDSDSDDDSSQ